MSFYIPLFWNSYNSKYRFWRCSWSYTSFSWSICSLRTCWAGGWWLFGLVMLWTPAHFWALVLLLKDDYSSVGIPMLPSVKGSVVTVRAISRLGGLLFLWVFLEFLLCLKEDFYMELCCSFSTEDFCNLFIDWKSSRWFK